MREIPHLIYFLIKQSFGKSCRKKIAIFASTLIEIKKYGSCVKQQAVNIWNGWITTKRSKAAMEEDSYDESSEC